MAAVSHSSSAIPHPISVVPGSLGNREVVILDCPICLESFPEDKMVKTKCFHAFDRVCFDNWFSRSNLCPSCGAAEKDPEQVNANNDRVISIEDYVLDENMMVYGEPPAQPDPEVELARARIAAALDAPDPGMDAVLAARIHLDVYEPPVLHIRRDFLSRTHSTRVIRTFKVCAIGSGVTGLAISATAAKMSTVPLAVGLAFTGGSLLFAAAICGTLGWKLRAHPPVAPIPQVMQ